MLNQRKYYRSMQIGLIAAFLLLAYTGCASMKSENGVTIEKKAGNPLKFW